MRNGRVELNFIDRVQWMFDDALLIAIRSLDPWCASKLRIDFFLSLALLHNNRW